MTLTDRRTGADYRLDIEHGAIRAAGLGQVRAHSDDPGLAAYDPAFKNTAACISRITYIDGDKGILRYRGYPIEQLAEGHSYLDIAWLILNGELPTPAESASWRAEITALQGVSDPLPRLLDGFAQDGHPMAMFIALLSGLGAMHPDSKNVTDPECRAFHIRRLIAAAPTLAAMTYRRGRGLAPVPPSADLSFPANFLRMVFGEDAEIDPALERAMDVLFILHVDHEQNCSTSAMRGVGSSHADPYSSAAAASAALYGPLHGGANEAVLKMLTEIGSLDNVPGFLEEVKGGARRLMGFGHRVYKRLRPPRQDHQADRLRGLRDHRQEPEDRHRARTGAGGASGGLLRPAPALPERGLLLRDHLRGAGLPGGPLPGALRGTADVRLARPVAGDAGGSGAEDRAGRSSSIWGTGSGRFRRARRVSQAELPPAEPAREMVRGHVQGGRKFPEAGLTSPDDG